MPEDKIEEIVADVDSNLSFSQALDLLEKGYIVKRKSLVCEDHRKCSSGFTWHLPLRKRSTYFVTRIANLVLLYGLRDF